MRSPAQHGEQLPELDERVIFAFLLTLGAGLATSLGSLLGVMSRRFNPGLLTLALSFSAGVMLFISFVEIFPKARLISHQRSEALLDTSLRCWHSSAACSPWPWLIDACRPTDCPCGE